MRFREPFTLFRKKLASGKSIYYYTTYDNFGRRKQYSTGCRTKGKAKEFCYKIFQEDELIRSKNVLFSDYVRDWFIYDKCPYIASIIANGKKYSKNVAHNRRRTLDKYFIPYFGKLYLSEITVPLLEDWKSYMKKLGRTNNTINTYLDTIKIIINSAHREGLIKTNPMLNLKYLSYDHRNRTTLTDKEITMLFKKENIERIWSKEIHYLISYVAANTGMRIGEIQALMMKNVKKDHIIVKHSWDRKYGLSTTKNGKTRIVPITYELFTKIKEYNSKTNSELIFIEEGKEEPTAGKNNGLAFYHALNNIGISDIERKERNITFHSWRHYFNTKLIKDGIPLPIIQEIIGHSTKAMTENYTKLTKDDLVNALNKV